MAPDTGTSTPAATERLIDRLRHLQAIEMESARALGGWLPGVVSWEAKHAIAEHVWQHAAHSRDLRTRLWELRIPRPDRDLGAGPRRVIEAMSTAPDDATFLAGAYQVLAPAVARACREHLELTHPVYDAPTVPILEAIIATKQRQIDWAEPMIAAATRTGEDRRRQQRWRRYLSEMLAAHGGVAGDGPADVVAEPDPPPGTESPLPFMEAKRDDRFELALESGVPAADDDRLGQVLFQFANYGAEMQAAETLGSVLWEATGMPWAFYYDLARHTYDEARHARLGEARLAELGYHLGDFPHSTANYTWRQTMDPLRRYCTLTYVIEADSFAYKHETYRRHLEHGDHASAQAVLFDIRDETLHVRWGKKWVPELMRRYGHEGDLEGLVAECRSLTARNSANAVQRSSADATSR